MSLHHQRRRTAEPAPLPRYRLKDVRAGAGQVNDLYRHPELGCQLLLQLDLIPGHSSRSKGDSDIDVTRRPLAASGPGAEQVRGTHCLAVL